VVLDTKPGEKTPGFPRLERSIAAFTSQNFFVTMTGSPCLECSLTTWITGSRSPSITHTVPPFIGWLRKRMGIIAHSNNTGIKKFRGIPI